MGGGGLRKAWDSWYERDETLSESLVFGCSEAISHKGHEFTLSFRVEWGRGCAVCFSFSAQMQNAHTL